MNDHLSPLTADALLSRIARDRVVAIIRGRDAEASVATCLTLVEAGISLLEVSLTTERALQVIEQVAAHLPGDVLLGAGTVVDPADVARVMDAGARYLVTPSLAPSLETAAEHAIPVLAGAMTPTEAAEAHRRGAAAVKIFPAGSLGPGYLRALRDPFPDIPLLAVGGVGADQAQAYLDAGAIGLGVGSPLCGDAPHGGDLAALRERAAVFTAFATAGDEARS
jgi:2-dehydro-3-deoxyphosphogluconate aldolase/(4S)-4-hydroxy-2-oxoglutarate aldolase